MGSPAPISTVADGARPASVSSWKLVTLWRAGEGILVSSRWSKQPAWSSSNVSCSLVLFTSLSSQRIDAITGLEGGCSDASELGASASELGAGASELGAGAAGGARSPFLPTVPPAPP